MSQMKCDTVSKSCLHWYQKDFYPSEPIFVPRSKSGSCRDENESEEEDLDEDDGIVLSLVNSEVVETELFLLVLDGKTFKEVARAQVSTPSAIPAGFHGYFFDK